MKPNALGITGIARAAMIASCIAASISIATATPSVAQQVPTTHLPPFYVLRFDDEAVELLHIHSLFQDGDDIRAVVVFAARDGATVGMLRRVRFHCATGQVSVEASAMMWPEGQGAIQQEDGQSVRPANGSAMSQAVQVACSPARHYDPDLALDVDLDEFLSAFWSGELR